MTDLASWAPLATGVAAVMAAGVNLVLGSDRQKRLKLAIDVADKIPQVQQAAWTAMIYRDVERIMERARRPRWIASIIFASWGLLTASFLFPEQFKAPLLWSSNVVAAVYLILTLVHLRAEKSDVLRFAERNDALTRSREARDASLEARARAQTKFAVWLLMSQGASRKEARSVVAWNVGDEDNDEGYGADWASLVTDKRGRVSWRIRRARFHEPAPPYSLRKEG